MVILKTVSIGCSSVHQPVDHVLQNKTVKTNTRHYVIKRKPTLCCVPRILSQMMRLCSLRESRSRARASNSARVVNSEAYRNCFLGSCKKNTYYFWYKASRASLTVIFAVTVQYSFPEVRNGKDT